jgi:hypothetical protein
MGDDNQFGAITFSHGLGQERLLKAGHRTLACRSSPTLEDGAVVADDVLSLVPTLG